MQGMQLGLQTMQAALGKVRSSGELFGSREFLGSNYVSRAVGAIEKIIVSHAKDTIVAFSHGDVIKLIVAYYSGIALDNFQRLAISPASISVIELGPFGARLGRLNDTGPLQNHQHPKK